MESQHDDELRGIHNAAGLTTARPANAPPDAVEG
jgi:hypothetical protein